MKIASRATPEGLAGHVLSTIGVGYPVSASRRTFGPRGNTVRNVSVSIAAS